MNQNLCNMLSILKNGQENNKKSVLQKRSKLCENVLNLLWDEGFISGFRISKTNSKYLEIFLKYFKEIPSIAYVKSISKPNRPVNYSIRNIWKFDSKLGIIVLSTNAGIMTIEKSKKLKIGGKALFIIK